MEQNTATISIFSRLRELKGKKSMEEFLAPIVEFEEKLSKENLLKEQLTKEQLSTENAGPLSLLRRVRIDTDIEKDIIIGMIMDNNICKKLSEITKLEYFQQPHYRIISKWVMEYYNKYQKAPKMDMTMIYDQQKTTLKEPDAELVSDILDKLLNERYAEEYSKKGLNVDYIVDNAINFFKRRDLGLKANEALTLNEKNQYSAAVKILQNYDNSKFEQKIDIESGLPTLTDILHSEIELEWVWERLVPKNAITVLYGPGGEAKTWLGLQLGMSICSNETSFLGYDIQKESVVYIDFENPIPVLQDRAKILGESDLKIWHTTHEIPPPRMDTEEWIKYKQLQPGVIIFDTLRSCQNLDENNSKDMAFIMNRFKELRDMGFTVIVLHHTPKADKGVYKGSTAIQDLCDHLLSIQKVGPFSIEKDGKQVLKVGAPKDGKTRYLPHTIFIQLVKNKGLSISESEEELIFQDLIRILKEFETPPNQGEFQKTISKELGLSKGYSISLIKKGIGKHWVEKTLEHNKKIYEIMSKRLLEVKDVNKPNEDEDNEV